MKAKEHPRAPTSPGLVRKGAGPPHTTLPRTQEPGSAQPHPHRSGCWAPAGSLVHTGSERSPAGSRSGAGSSGTGIRLYLGGGGEGWLRAEVRWGPRRLGLKALSPTAFSVSRGGAGLGRVSGTHTYSPESYDSRVEVAGGWGEIWVGWNGVRC